MEHELQGQQYICTVTSKTSGKREFVYRLTKFPLFLSLTVHYFYIKLSSFTEVLSIRIVLSRCYCCYMIESRHVLKT